LRESSANVATAEGFVCAKAQQQQDVGHEGGEVSGTPTLISMRA